MKPRIELNPKAIRHFRVRLEWSQKDAAECLRKSKRQEPESLIAMYQRIERTGITSPRTAEKLAAHFNVSIPQLQGPLPDDDRFGLWWLESDAFGEGWGILHSRIGVLNSLRNETAMHEPSTLKAERVHAYVNFDPTTCSLTLPRRALFSGDIPRRTWILHPARRTEAGIAFVRFTEYELEHITSVVKQIAFSVADSVSLNGAQTPPERAALGYIVIRYSSKPISAESHERFYRTEAEVRRYLVRHTRNQPHERINLVAERDLCTLRAVGADWWFTVRRAYQVRSNSGAQIAPWRHTSIKRFVNELHTSFERAFDGIEYVGIDIHTGAWTPADPRTPLPEE